MKSFAVFILLILLSVTTFAQRPRPTKTPKPTPSPTVDPAIEKEEFSKAVAIAGATERVAALQKFIVSFPESNEKNRALELTTSARAALADEKLRAGEREIGIELFKLAVQEAPKPISDKLYTEVVLQIPSSLVFRGERAAAIEVAKLIEEKTEGNAKQLLGLAGFYLGTENALEAKRLADKAIALEPNLPAAYQTLGLAHRLDFQLEDSATAYAKALELDANSVVSKRSLAEMKRAVGKASEAVALYREILAKDDSDSLARTGLILALLDANNKTEAETEMQKSLEANPNNLFLLTGAAYWYAAHEQGAKAIELAEKAVAVEPRYTWARIALARGLMQQKRPFDAEKALLAARQYGDFPTLDYELATARFQSGFYREAAEGLQKKFLIKDNLIETNLGGRVAKSAKNFTELLAAERRASIFQTLAADNTETAERLKSLLDFSQKLETATDETTISAADEFIKGDDKMKIHRQLFVAGQLLQKRKALPKVLELSKAAVSGVNAGLDSPNSVAAVLADELYQSRRIAIARNELIIVPDVSRQTLSNILRGRIEDIAGWALFQDSKSDEAVIRLKRAVSVLPEKSAWWRTSMWRLGAAQESAGNQKDALDAYIKSYTSGEADVIKYGVIESVYQKVNGNTDGLEAKIGAKPASIAANFPVQTETKTDESLKAVQPTPEIKSETSPTPSTTDAAQTVTETKPAPQISNSEAPVTKPELTSKTELSPTKETKPENTATTEIKPEPTLPSETKTETKKEEPNKNQTSETATKPLFDPIVITVPKVEPVKKPSTETNSKEVKPVQDETPKVELKTDEANQDKKPSDETVESRPRVVKEKEAETASTCQLIVSEENISILNNGGNLSLFVRFEGVSDTSEIKATSSSPGDVEISTEPEANNQSSRAFFVVKSISPKIGIFTITFEAACGKKEVAVKVR